MLDNAGDIFGRFETVLAGGYKIEKAVVQSVEDVKLAGHIEAVELLVEFNIIVQEWILRGCLNCLNGKNKVFLLI